MTTRPLVCLSSQDWEVDLKTNRQRITAELARRGHPAVFVETGTWIGTYVRQDGIGLRRKLRRLLGVERVEGGVLVHHAINPLPGSWRWRRAAELNARSNAAVLRVVLRRLGHATGQTAIAYDPRAVRTARHAGAEVVLYDCVDDHEHTVEGPQRKAMSRFDRRAAEDADAVVATTEPLRARHAASNPRTSLVPNVADFGHFASERIAVAPRRARPVLGFAGNLIALKVDLELLEELARRRPEWDLVLAGPHGTGAEAGLARLGRLANVRLPGLVPFAELPALYCSFDVGLIPYRANSYTASCFPLKLYEYLATGLPVVATGLPSLPDLGDDLVMARADVGALEGAVEAQLGRRSAADVARRKALAGGHTWEGRADALMAVATAVRDQREAMA